VGKPAKKEFDPKAFLAKVGMGKTILKFNKKQHVFEQGDVADSVFYLQKGSVKLTVVSGQGKEAVVGILEPGQFSARAASMAIDCASRPRRRWKNV
jgi:CRP/FNR family transcriptional regulator, cyclic AMP receptor protein